MPKAQNGDKVITAEVFSVQDAGKQEAEGMRLVTILHSQGHDLYRVPAIDRPCWLSVKVYELPATELAADAIYLGAATTANGRGWRKAYARTWRSVITGGSVTVPADDPMVLDYAASAAFIPQTGEKK